MLQREVSDHTGISRSQISLYLKGVKSPTVDEFIDICHAIDALPHKVMVQATYTVHWRKARGIEDEHVKPDDTELRVLAWGDGPATP